MTVAMNDDITVVARLRIRMTKFTNGEFSDGVGLLSNTISIGEVEKFQDTRV